MPDKDLEPDLDLDAQIDRMVDAALGGMTPHEVLMQSARADTENVEERAAAKAKNRERAMVLLAAIEKTLG